MPTPRIGLVTVTGFCCLVGCAATEKTPTAAPDTGQVARNAWGEPVEVTPPTWCDELEVETLEEYWPEGGLMAQPTMGPIPTPRHELDVFTTVCNLIDEPGVPATANDTINVA